MTAIQKTPLGVGQAVDILEILALLGAEQHKTSKIVFYDTKIALEQDSPMRTALAWSASVTATVSYYAGYSSETGSRELSCLPPLMKRVHAVLTDQQNIPADFETLRNRQDLAQKAETGLRALKATSYQIKDEKKALVEAALATVAKIKKFYNEKYDEPLLRNRADMISRGHPDPQIRERLAAEKDLEIASLRTRIEELEQLIERYQKNGTDWQSLVAQTKKEAETQITEKYQQKIADLERSITQEQANKQNWVQLLTTNEQEYSKKLAEKDRLLASVTLANTVDLEKVPTETVLAMLRVLTDVLAERLAKS